MRVGWMVAALSLIACRPTAPAPASTAAPAPTPAPATAPAPAEPSPPADIATPPFSPDQLRAGLPAGTELRLRLTRAGQAPVIQHWRFTAADAQGCTIAARTLAEDGSLIADDGAGTSTWAELATHAHFPAARTSRTRSSVDVPAGHLATWLYEVLPETPGGPTKRLHFSPALPGPPVRMEVIQDGAAVLTMELVSHTGL